MSPFDVLLAILVAGLWGLNFVAAKYVIDYFPLFYWITLRSAICAAILMPFCGRPPASFWRLFTLGHTASTLNSAFRFGGIEVGLSVSMAVILDKLSAVFSVLLSMFFFREKIKWRTKIGITLAIVGTLFLSYAPKGGQNMLGFAMVVIGSFFWATYNIQIKKISTKRYTALLGWSCMLGSIIPSILTLIFEKNHIDLLLNVPVHVAGALLFTALGPLLIAYLIWYYLLEKYSVSQVVPFSLLEPILATVFAAVLLKEPVTSRLIIGFLIVFSGIVIIVFRRPQHASGVR